MKRPQKTEIIIILKLLISENMYETGYSTGDRCRSLISKLYEQKNIDEHGVEYLHFEGGNRT